MRLGLPGASKGAALRVRVADELADVVGRISPVCSACGSIPRRGQHGRRQSGRSKRHPAGGYSRPLRSGERAHARRAGAVAEPQWIWLSARERQRDRRGNRGAGADANRPATLRRRRAGDPLPVFSRVRERRITWAWSSRGRSGRERRHYAPLWRGCRDSCRANRWSGRTARRCNGAGGFRWSPTGRTAGRFCIPTVHRSCGPAGESSGGADARAPICRSRQAAHARAGGPVARFEHTAGRRSNEGIACSVRSGRRGAGILVEGTRCSSRSSRCSAFWV